jgi:hypothetical protein
VFEDRLIEQGLRIVRLQQRFHVGSQSRVHPTDFGHVCTPLSRVPVLQGRLENRLFIASHGQTTPIFN